MTRFGLPMAIAVVAAALADPIVEFASNSGWFGSVSFTDHSNLDILPALLVGVGLLAFYMVRRARAVLAGQVLQQGVVLSLPAIFALQLLALYVMETAEQLVVWRHLLGQTAWLGGPLPMSLTIHAILCLAVALTIARSKRALAATTLRVMRILAAIVLFAVRATRPILAARFESICFKELLPLLCSIGERAPPAVAG
ncbi:MAG: hypothetical protein WBW76_04465, partial [Candidatus Cybelea sp.]